jgi:hypothetical protein
MHFDWLDLKNTIMQKKKKRMSQNKVTKYSQHFDYHVVHKDPVNRFSSSSLILYSKMASHLLRTSLRAIARPAFAKTFTAAPVRHMPSMALTATRAFSAGLPRFGSGAGKFFFNFSLDK